MLGVWSPVWESGWGWLDGWAFKLLQIRGGSAQNTETWFQLSNYCALHFCDTQPTVQTRSLNFSTFRPTDVYSQKLSGVNLLYQMHSENCISCRKFHPLDWYALHIACILCILCIIWIVCILFIFCSSCMLCSTMRIAPFTSSDVSRSGNLDLESSTIVPNHNNAARWDHIQLPKTGWDFKICHFLCSAWSSLRIPLGCFLF